MTTQSEQAGQKPLVLDGDVAIDPNAELKLDEFYKYTCLHIEREEHLIDHRISWMLTSQGFLLTGFAVATSRGGVPSLSPAALTAILGFVGIAIALLSLTGIRAAYRSIDNLLTKWDERSGGKKSFFPDITTPKASGLRRVLGYGLPLVLLAVWPALIVTNLISMNLIPALPAWPF
jgi:hypothetical protein